MGVLNFSTDNLITGINIIDGNLYWTDNKSEPKKLEIDRFRGYDHSNNQTIIGLDNVIESDLSVIRLHPFKTIDLELEAYTPTATQPEPPFEQIFPRFSYRWRFEDGAYSPYAPFTQAAFLPAARALEDNIASGTVIDTTQDGGTIENIIEIDPATSEGTFIAGPVTISGVGVLEVLRVETRITNRQGLIFGVDLPTRNVLDGATVTQDITSTEETNYIEGFNTTMYNNVGRIVLNNIPRGPRDAVAVQLLYTESISSNI